MTTHPSADPHGDRRALFLAALEYGVHPLLAREAVATTRMSRGADGTHRVERAHAELGTQPAAAPSRPPKEPR